MKRWKPCTFFLPLVTYMGILLRGWMSFFLHHGFAVNILDQSPLAKCCNGSRWVKDSAGWLLGFYGAAWSQWAEQFHRRCRCLENMDEIIPAHAHTDSTHYEPHKQKGSDAPPYKYMYIHPQRWKSLVYPHTHTQTEELTWWSMCRCG